MFTGLIFDIILLSMRRTIENINNGQIDREFGTLVFSVISVEHTVLPGAVCEGSFSVTGSEHHLTEGYVYADDYRMECITREFSGVQDEIAYRFRASDMMPGQDVRGNFILVTNRGEYQIPFCIHTDGDSLDSSVGPIRNLFHFTNLAKTKWKEAVSMFYDPAFAGIFTGSDREYLSLYRCLSGVKGSERNMDEFLISIHKKTPIEYIPAEKSIEISDPAEPSRYGIDIVRNGWGYAHLRLETEGDFLSVEEREVTYDSFLGNRYQLYYYVDPSNLHTGRNYGAIHLITDRSEQVIPIVIKVTGERMYLKDMVRTRMRGIVSLMEYYESHRLKKITTRTWLDESEAIVRDMLASDPEDLRARLYQVHLMITRGHSNEAIWNLRKIREQAQSVRSENAYLWCYYLYLNSLIEEGDMDIDTLTEEVEYCYKSDPDNWRLCWLLSVMSDDYGNALHRWKMYEDAYERGCNSPAIYLEAARIAEDNPTIISKLDGFDMQVIRYMCKKGLMNDELALVIRTIADRTKEYSPTLVRLLAFCYQDNPNDELLTVICTQLIRGNQRDRNAHKWYGYAVMQELKITRLFEYYMYSIDMSRQTEIPRIVLMYFSFQSDLDYETNAYLYAYVAANRDKDPDMYSKYLRQITEFVSDQINAGRNTRYLAVLYRDIIDSAMLDDPQTATKVADICFIHEVDLSEYPDAVKLILCYDHRDGEEVYPVNNGRAYVPIFSDDCCLAIEDADGNRSAGTANIEPERLMPPGRILMSLQLTVKDHVGIDTQCCVDQHGTADVKPENEFRFRNLLEKERFSPEYARTVTMKLARFYYDQDKAEELDSFLDKLRSEDVAGYERAECIRLMVKRNLYDKAIDWIYRYGPEGVDKVIISDLIYGWLPVHRDDPGEYEKLLTQLVFACLESGHVTLPAIQYEMKHIEGTVRMLRDTWVRARELQADCHDIEERMLIQILYTGTYIKELPEILRDYAYHEPDRDVLSAALANAAYEDFVEGAVISDQTFDVMTDAYESGLEPGKVCDLAYVRHMAENPELIDERIRPILRDALHRLLADDVVISCFKDLADFMPSMSRFADSVIVEYRTAPDTRVDIHYIVESEDDDYNTDPMNEVCKGVYSKMFTIFFGEKIMYYITEESDDEREKLSESNTLARNDMGDSVSKGRFGLIDDMCIGRALRDYSTVDALMEEYYRKEYMSGRLFGMHKD